MGWGCGYGPKEFFDYTNGETLFPMARMTDVEKRTISQSTRGGGPIEGGMVVEEPDFGWPQKGEVCKGKYASGQIPYAPGFLAAQQQRERGGFNNEPATATPGFNARPPFMPHGLPPPPRPGPPFGPRGQGMAGTMPPGMPPPPGMGPPGMGMGMPRPSFQHPHSAPPNRGTGIMVVTDRQYDERDDRDRWRNRQTQDRGEEHVVVLGGGDDMETPPAAAERPEEEYNGDRRDSEQEYGGRGSRIARRGSGGPPDWPYPYPPPPGSYAMPPGPGMRPPWDRNAGPYGGPYHGAPPGKLWGLPPPGWNGPGGGKPSQTTTFA